MALAGKGNEKIWPQGSLTNVIIYIVVWLDFLISVKKSAINELQYVYFPRIPHSLHDLKYKITSNHAQGYSGRFFWKGRFLSTTN